MQGAQSIADESAWARSWLRRAALPLWAGPGFDGAAGTFVERLDHNGRPCLDLPRRLIVQCRQIYAYAQASVLGWYDGDALVRTALAALRQYYHSSDGRPGWVFSADRDGRTVDARRDAYSHAFALFALAWGYRLTGDTALVTLADRTLAELDALLGDGVGLRTDDTSSDGLRLQNPHMHLFEAVLELHRAVGAPRYAEHARRLHALFISRFLDRENRCLPELFDARWKPVALPGQHWEPGHHFEWIWLLARHAALTDAAVEDDIAVLLARAEREGVDHLGHVIDAVAIPGARRTASLRVWPQCEAVKAYAALAERLPQARATHAAKAAGALTRLRQTFLRPAIEGGWIDRVDAHGVPDAPDIPASTLYHLVFAVSEAGRVFACDDTAMHDRLRR
jgi:mannose-6-phosphate isomerase